MITFCNCVPRRVDLICCVIAFSVSGQHPNYRLENMFHQKSATEPLTHVVAFKFDVKQFNVPQVKAGLAKLRKIPGVISLEFGPINTALFEGYPDRSQGYTHLLVSKHTDAEAQRVYLVHPLHIEWVALVKPMTIQKPIAFDVTSHL